MDKVPGRAAGGPDRRAAERHAHDTWNLPTAARCRATPGWVKDASSGQSCRPSARCRNRSNRVIGVAPAHRAVSEMRDAGVPETQTLAAFIHDAAAAAATANDRTSATSCFSWMKLDGPVTPTWRSVQPDCRAGTRGLQRRYRPAAVHCPGQPFRLLQKRSAIDVAVMQDRPPDAGT